MTAITPANSPYKVSANVTDTSDVVFSGGSMFVLSGGTANKTTVSSGGFLTIDGGGSGSRGVIAGQETVFGYDSGTSVVQGGTAIVSSGGTEAHATVTAGGVLKIIAGATVTSATTNSGTIESIASGGVVVGAQVNNNGYVTALGTKAGLLLSSSSVVVPLQLVSSGGSNGGTTSGYVVASGGAAHIDLDNSHVADQVLTTSGSKAMIDTVAGSSDRLANVVLTSGSLFEISDSSVLALVSEIANSATISAAATSDTTALDILGDVTLIGGGKVQLSSSGNACILPFSANVKLTNVDNTILGAGSIGDGTSNLIFTNSGVVDATGVLTVETGNTAVVNAGTMEATGSGTLHVLDMIIDNKLAGIVVASGAKARVSLDGGTLSGGTVETEAKAAVVTASGTMNTISGTTVVGGSLVEATSSGSLYLQSVTIASGATAAASGGGELFVISTTIASGATVETLSGGTAVFGAVTNSGTIFASGANSFVTFLGAVNGGGIVEIANGTAAIAGNEAATFANGGKGELELFDDAANAHAYNGEVSSFGKNTHQTIDLVNVASAANVKLAYASANAANTSGTLTVSSGGVVVADIDLIGQYTLAKFKLGADSTGDVTIVDPPIAAAHTHVADLGVFGHHMAGSLVVGGGTVAPAADAPVREEQPQLAPPQHT